MFGAMRSNPEMKKQNMNKHYQKQNIKKEYSIVE